MRTNGELSRLGWIGTTIMLLFAGVLSREPASAFGPKGHKLVAAIAEHYLTPDTRKQVKDLLNKETDYTVAGCPVNSLEDAAYWPDCLKEHPETYRHTFNWHFDNIPLCGSGNYSEYCPGGNCLSAKLGSFVTTLKNRTAPARERLEALKFIAHLVGDLHQPLHMINNNDQGGNLIKTKFFGKESNLHVVWDIELVERVAPGDVTTEASGLAATITNNYVKLWSASTLKDWISESYALAKNIVYAKLPHPPACNQVPSGVETLGEEYYAAVKDVEVLQLKRAGVRLAKVLNDAL